MGGFMSKGDDVPKAYWQYKGYISAIDPELLESLNEDVKRNLSTEKWQEKMSIKYGSNKEKVVNEIVAKVNAAAESMAYMNYEHRGLFAYPYSFENLKHVDDDWLYPVFMSHVARIVEGKYDQGYNWTFDEKPNDLQGHLIRLLAQQQTHTVNNNTGRVVSKAGNAIDSKHAIIDTSNNTINGRQFTVSEFNELVLRIAQTNAYSEKPVSSDYYVGHSTLEHKSEYGSGK